MSEREFTPTGIPDSASPPTTAADQRAAELAVQHQLGPLVRVLHANPRKHATVRGLGMTVGCVAGLAAILLIDTFTPFRIFGVITAALILGIFIGIVQAIRGLLTAPSDTYLHEHGVVHLRGTRADALTWPEIAGVQMVHSAQHNGRRGAIRGWRVTPRKSGAMFVVPALGADSAGEFGDLLMSAHMQQDSQ